jgi:hypothetical protein
MRSVLVWLALVLAMSTAAADRARVRQKPSAPVALSLTVTGDVVTLDAVATRDVTALELRLGAEVSRFGPTRAGQRRRLEARIAVPTPGGIDVIGSARTGGRNRVTSIRLGSPAAEQPRRFELRTVAGKPVAEVRE